MIELDFLFIYEHKVRELENLCLMKYELDRRGYITKIMHIEDAEALTAMRPVYHTKVMVMMACYDNPTIEWHAKNFVTFDKIIDLQWENIVFPRDEKEEKAFKNYSGIAKDVVRVSWGEMNQRRMLNVAKMDPKKVKLIGHVGMDFLRDGLKGYYASKEQIASRFNIDPDKKLFLFVSPYFSDELPKDYLEDLVRRFGEGWRTYYKDCMLPSKEIVLDWIGKTCRQRSDIVFIYRPHPGEVSNTAKQLEESYSNFRVIGELSIKQWILISDKIYTGNSSTFVEAFFARKMCYFLFPIPVSSDYELAFLQKADRVVTYEEFERTTHEKDGPFPVSEQLIDEVYSIDWKTPSYIKFADMAEEVISDPYYALTKDQLKSYRTKLSLGGRAARIFARMTPLYRIYLQMLESPTPKWKWLETKRIERKRLRQVADDFECTSDEEITSIIARIAYELEK